MRPRIICHMLSSIDGRIDGAALRSSVPEDEYETTGKALEGDAWICGRTTMQQHFAAAGEFYAENAPAAGPQPVHVAQQAESYAIVVDTKGKLLWDGADLDGDHLICFLSEQVTTSYLEYLRERGISFVVTGRDAVELGHAVELLAEHFGVRRLLLEGGGHINGAFLAADLVDEVSLLLIPGIDGRQGIATSFDGLPATRTAISLKLQSAEHRQHDVLWLRYDVLRQSA